MKTTTATTKSVKFIIPPVEIQKLTDRQIDNRIAKIADLDSQIKALQAERDALKAEITEAIGTEHETAHYIIRNTSVTSQRFDSKAFKAAEPETYAAYCKETTANRFTYKAK